mgnify:CR=1 FL=1
MKTRAFSSRQKYMRNRIFQQVFNHLFCCFAAQKTSSFYMNISVLLYLIFAYFNNTTLYVLVFIFSKGFSHIALHRFLCRCCLFLFCLLRPYIALFHMMFFSTVRKVHILISFSAYKKHIFAYSQHHSEKNC